MTRMRGPAPAWAVTMLGLLALVLPASQARAQFALGGQVAVTELDLTEANWGLGGRAVLGVPLTGLGAQATLDVFDLDCGSGSCRSQSLGVHLLYSFPVPLLMNPYVGAGVSLDASESLTLDWGDGELDWNLLAGVILSGPAFPTVRPFAEARYELEDGGTVFSGGVLVYLF